MDQTMTMLFAFLESSGIWAPIVFILFHSLRQFLFLPVTVLCLVGGILFGTILGSIYSLVGLTLSCILFYFFHQTMPKTFGKIQRMKEKWLGDRVSFTYGQIALLRCVPFMQYHLLSLIMLERKKNLFSFTKKSFLTNIPLAILYTFFGQSISTLSLSIIIGILATFTILFYVLREKQIRIKWKEFFVEKAS
ncbi:putative membrane protein YdjX (TVP38/TMEM64 family) [Bacillus mesophilus]|uniref:TVP38/TMEM64 family membrane protein n=1 Tax=Bacillus mesophilus TaxID=1808955 RepID=A0A6M0Q7Y6_9BACI|nr:VTT domain-containing protein [Bacillus mesophilus]MBM7660593.1 putative membrane protein YdjX (TVP38/TMEM64 family) [Bacillus mesophilus]NEY71859.1 TVP38/TMEM64 family protein [Bacillus mesophilus]